MTQKELEFFLDNMLFMLEEVKQFYIQKKTEAMEKSLQFDEERKAYCIRERTIQDLIYTVKTKQKEINSMMKVEEEKSE